MTQYSEQNIIQSSKQDFQKDSKQDIKHYSEKENQVTKQHTTNSCKSIKKFYILYFISLVNYKWNNVQLPPCFNTLNDQIDLDLIKFIFSSPNCSIARNEIKSGLSNIYPSMLN